MTDAELHEIAIDTLDYVDRTGFEWKEIIWAMRAAVGKVEAERDRYKEALEAILEHCHSEFSTFSTAVEIVCADALYGEHGDGDSCGVFYPCIEATPETDMRCPETLDGHRCQRKNRHEGKHHVGEHGPCLVWGGKS
jgi:hypothetical protein